MSHANSHRIFFSLSLSPEILNACQTEQEALAARKPEPVRYKLIPVHQLHLTLRFLGRISASQLEGLKACKIQLFRESIPLNITGLRGFPKSSRSRVLAFEIEASAKLMELYTLLNLHLRTLGFPPAERNFQPHITLIRARPETQCQQISHRLARGFATELNLMASELHHDGPVYTPLWKMPLKGPDHDEMHLPVGTT